MFNDGNLISTVKLSLFFLGGCWLLPTTVKSRISDFVLYHIKEPKVSC